MQADTNDDPRGLFDQIAHDLALRHDGISAGKMFGTPCIKTHGKAFAAFSENAIALKLAGDDHRAALALAGAQLWDPSGKHRPMKEWVQIRFENAHAWAEIAEQALRYVANSTPHG